MYWQEMRDASNVRVYLNPPEKVRRDGKSVVIRQSVDIRKKRCYENSLSVSMIRRPASDHSEIMRMEWFPLILAGCLTTSKMTTRISMYA